MAENLSNFLERLYIRQKALDQLAIVKKQEQKKLQKGFEYVKVDDKTWKLVKTK